MSLSFFKMNGAGNDFLLLDCMKEDGFIPLKKEEIVYLCDRNFGLGADGLVVLAKGRGKHCEWRFFNCDGSEAGMCGNAARCVVRFLADKYFPLEDVITIETKVGVIKGRPMGDDGQVEITLIEEGLKRIDFWEKIIKMDDTALRLYCIDTGVPHAVLEVTDIRKYPITKVGKFLVGHAAFAPEGTNVTFFQGNMGQQILATTFERGVEKETLACGTGAAAAALVYSQLYMQPLPILVSVPGGDLHVDLSPTVKKLLLKGPTDYAFHVRLEDIPDDFVSRKPFEGAAL